MDYITKMNEILKSKVEQGMTGIRFCIESESNTMQFAHDFCMIEDAVTNGRVESTTEPICL